MIEIETEKEYKQILKKIEEITIELEYLVCQVQRYEDSNYKIEKPDPIDAIKFRMEQKGLKQKDMKEYLGSKSKVSEVLNKKIKLSLNMIRKLHVGMEISTDILMQEYKIE